MVNIFHFEYGGNCFLPVCTIAHQIRTGSRVGGDNFRAIEPIDGGRGSCPLYWTGQGDHFARNHGRGGATNSKTQGFN